MNGSVYVFMARCSTIRFLGELSPGRMRIDRTAEGTSEAQNFSNPTYVWNI